MMSTQEAREKVDSMLEVKEIALQKEISDTIEKAIANHNKEYDRLEAKQSVIEDIFVEMNLGSYKDIKL